MGEPELIGVTERCGLLLGRVRDRPHPLREALVRRSLHARLERITPPLIGELSDVARELAGEIERLDARAGARRRAG